MTTFINICKKLQVPIADEKTEGPTSVMEYLGLTIDTREMAVKIPDKKMKELLVLIRGVAFSKKVTLKNFILYVAFLHFAQGLFQQTERLVGVYTWLHQKQKSHFI
jgi:hypothetical protein